MAIPKQDIGLATMNVVGFEADDPGDVDAIGLAGNASLAYESPDHLYLASSPYAVWGGCFDVCPLVTDFRVADSGTTMVFDFEVSGTEATYVGSGEVEGSVADRWAMDEYDGVLRLAVGPTQATGNFNSVVTLERRDDELVEIGRVDKLGVNEQIESVRWFAGLAIVVTFRQVDPLYSVDLSDPANPVVRGELKIEGYSAYLHPVNQDRLIGLGQDASLQGQRLGTQMSLFDVSNLDAPSRLAQVTFGENTDSNAEYDHHAFLYWAPEGLVVVPLRQYTFDPATGTESGFAGAVLVRLAGDGLSEIGRISHPTPSAGDPRAPESIHYGGIERSLVVGDQLYTVSPLGVAATDLDSLQQTAFAPFPVAQPGDVVIEGPVVAPGGESVVIP
jgi:hypothetical protein